MNDISVCAFIYIVWRQHPTKQQMYGHLPPIMKTIQVKQNRHAGHCRRSRGELLSDVLLWTPSHGHAKAGWSARTYIQQLCEDTWCSSGDLPEAMNDRKGWRDRVWHIHADVATRRWWMTVFFDTISFFSNALDSSLNINLNNHGYQ